QFADVAADLEPPPPPEHPDETRLDMNPLIDVALVLLIFFMLVTTYETIRKVLDMPTTTEQQAGKPRTPSKEEMDRTVKVSVRKQGDTTAIEVEDRPVDLKDLTAGLRSFHRNQMILIADSDVEWGTTVAIQDAAQGANIQKILRAKK